LISGYAGSQQIIVFIYSQNIAELAEKLTKKAS
jgi:hypothetical protein